MDQQSIQEEYEEIKIKLFMTLFAQMEGRTLLEENNELRKDSFYLPSERENRSFVRRLNLHFALLHLKRATRLFTNGYPKATVTVLLFIIVILFTNVWNVEAVRIKVLNMFVQVKQEYTSIFLRQESQQLEESHIQVKWDHAYVPTKVPKGYNVVNMMDNQTVKSIEYENGDHGYILFQQNNENSGMNVDTEGADEVIHTTIHGQNGLVVGKKDLITVVWQDNTRLFLILGESKSLTKEELIKMAESVKLFQ